MYIQNKVLVTNIHVHKIYIELVHIPTYIICVHYVYCTNQDMPHTVHLPTKRAPVPHLLVVFLQGFHVRVGVGFSDDVKKLVPLLLYLLHVRPPHGVQGCKVIHNVRYKRSCRAS